MTRHLRERVRTAIQNYADLPPAPFDETITPQTFYLATPNRLAYALGWLAANQIVQARFLASGIDAIPIFHPEHGWDRFLLTRRVSGNAFRDRPADEFGLLLLTGHDAPCWTSPDGTKRLPLWQTLLDQPERGIVELLAQIPAPPLGTSDETRIREREQAPSYPVLFNAVTELIIEHPGLIAAREVLIDTEQIDGQFHPLYLHATDLAPTGARGENVATTTHRWFQLQFGDRFAFVDRRGTRAIYRTDRGAWLQVKRQLDEEPNERIKARISAWLRLDGVEPEAGID